ncbi:MAG: calcium/sodium antiporter [Patescibacteria group bacterium]
MLTYVLFVIGFALLIKGADFLVDGASSIAKKLRIAPLVIGMTIVAFGTSAPELVVNVISSLQGKTDLAIGNIIGSNISNILLILGVSSIIFALKVKSSTVWKEIPLSLLAILVAGVLMNDALIDGAAISMLSRIDGLILIAFFLIFLYYTFGVSKNKDSEPTDGQIKTMPVYLSLLMIACGLAGLTFGGKWIVDGAVKIATSLGVSEAIIGLTIVAVGTSLPELATSAVAAYKKQSDIAVGNIIGSNIFNIFWILGVSAIIRPLPFQQILNRDIIFCIIATLLLFVFMFIGKKRLLERWQGVLFVILYALYITTLIVTSKL